MREPGIWLMGLVSGILLASDLRYWLVGSGFALLVICVIDVLNLKHTIRMRDHEIVELKDHLHHTESMLTHEKNERAREQAERAATPAPKPSEPGLSLWDHLKDGGGS